MKRHLNAVVIAALTIALLVGCSKKDDAPEKGLGANNATTVTASTTGSSAAPGKTDKKPTVNDIRDSQGSVKGYEGAIDDAKVAECSTESGQLKVSGSVTNPLSSTRQYRIYVSAMEKNETRGVVQIDVDPVEAGATALWAGTLAISDPGITCLLRVERFEPL